MRKFILLTGVLVWLIPATLSAREKPAFTQAFEAVYAQQLEESDPEALYDHLWSFYQHPLDLNQATREDLAVFGILSDMQLDQFFTHLEKNGPLVSIYELQAIPEFDLTTIYLLLPFVQVTETYPEHRLELQELGITSRQSNYWLAQYARTLETKRGYQLDSSKGITPYVGSPDQLLTRLKYSHPPGWSLGIAGRKAPGEAFTWDPATSRYGLNVWRAYISLQNKAYLKQLILGDYQIGYGQGLVLNAGFSRDKSSEAIPIMRTNNLGIKPHTSLASYGLRGGAATFTWNHLTQTIYYAYNELDARVFQDKATGELYVASLQRNNLYRTALALRKRGQVLEQVMGTTLIYQNKVQGLELGLNTLYNHYDLVIKPDPKKNSFNFSGQDHYNVSLFYRYLWHNLHCFGEGGISPSGGKALVSGVIASLSAKIDVSLLVRSYGTNFHSPYGKAFRKNSQSNRNEQGWYIGLHFQPISQVNLYAYYDYFKFPEPRPSLPEPSAGYDWLTKVTYQPSRNTLWLLQYQEMHKAKQVPLAKSPKPKDKKPLVKMGLKRRTKAQLKHALSPRLDLTTNAQFSHYQLVDPPTWGYGLVQRATYKLRLLRLTGQVAWFDTDADNKLYFYEKEVLYTSPVPRPYHQKGTKYAVLLTYQPTPSWRLELKYAFTWYIDQTKIGSGLEKIADNTQNELKLQAIYRF